MRFILLFKNFSCFLSKACPIYASKGGDEVPVTAFIRQKLLSTRVYSCWVNLSSIFQFHIGPSNLFKSSIIFSVNVKNDTNWEDQNK